MHRINQTFIVAMISVASGTGAVFAAAIPQQPGAEATLPLPKVVEFNRDIRPILSDRCFACHGPDENKRKVNLRLDTEAGLRSKVEGRPVIVAGKPDDSELYKRIVTTDDDERMPPAKIGNSPLKPLTDREKKLVRLWIEQGAPWQGHWAYLRPIAQIPPLVKDIHGLRRNAVDDFVLAKLMDVDLTPSREADRRTLIRRLSFDLIGLPPTPEEVDAFVNDKSADAYEKLVDRLLASKHFGERLAIYWLDLVRYADSGGYHSDNDRTVWLYRDYVINAFNDNKRFDQFTREQIAGDLMPNATWEQKIASGYNRMLCTTEEGGAQPKEYTAKYASDRVRSVGTVWLGATMNCTECHDHKYDPLTMKDFYGLAAFFADVQEAAVGRQAQTPVPTPNLEAQLKEMDAAIAALKQKLDVSTPELEAGQKAWEAEIARKLEGGRRSDVQWIVDQKTPEGGTRDGAFNFVAKDQGPVRGQFSRKQEAGELVQHFVINAKDQLAVGKGDMLFAYIYLDPKNPPKQVMLQFNVNNSWEHRAWWGEDLIPYGVVGSNGPNHKKMGPLPKTGEWVRLEVKPSDVGLKDGSKLNGMAFTQWGGLAYWADAGANRDGVGLPEAVVQAISVEAGKRNAAQKDTIAKHYRSTAPQLEPARAEIAAAQARRDAQSKQMPTTLITMATTPRMIRILKRGNWLDDTGEIMQPQVPAVFGELKAEAGKRLTRLDLANWMVAKENPATSRVFVNRLWMLYFGQGLSKTLEDFGSQGDWPSHPELLDWLALEFQKTWDVKQIVKLMVMSGTYRQSSVANADLRQKDPFNRWLARQGRPRLAAELIRDNALSVSGLLVPTIGGPSVKPYQPRGYWAYLNFPTREWQNDKGDGLYRRGLYTWWQRSFLHPSLLTFDASSREDGVCDRPRSNTPLQALVLLNDPTYVEAARALAEMTIKEGGAAPADRIQYTFRRVLQRKGSEAEVQVLAALLDKHRAQFAADKPAAEALLKIGEKPADKAIDAVELASWTNVARVVLNLHETITRE